jgi:FlaA1/EpsC-like NDP-sugar epimerase
MFDAVVVSLAAFVAFFLRFDGVIPPEYLNLYLASAIPLTIINIAFFYLFGLYNHIWTYASVDALLSVTFAVSLGGAASLVYLLVTGLMRFPYSVTALYLMLALLMIGGSRFIWRIAREKLLKKGNGGGKRILIYGAGDAGEAILREILNNKDSGYHAVGFIDDDPSKKNMTIHGIKVFGEGKDLKTTVLFKKAEEVIIAIPSAAGSQIRGIIDFCREANIAYKTLPPICQLLSGRVGLKDLRDIDVEDLLGRDQVKFDLGDVRDGLKGKTILITGAGGSIGSELSRQVALCSPKKLILLGHGENSIYHIDLEMRERFPDLNICSIIGNVRDRDKIFKVMQAHKPHFVFHAAAYKHVHLMEAHPDEAIANNVYGTKNVAEASLDAGVDKFILISTDKAVDPRGVMGCSKMIAEKLVMELQKKSKTKFIVTRFGNVLGSRGSVIPLFKRQIKNGGPVTVTHPDVVRYFMTIPEAVHLVIRAGLMGEGGEVFVLDMGEPMKIADLAKELITLSGREVDKDIRIEFTGLRPGEKLVEKLNSDDESLERTSHKKIYVARPKAGDRGKNPDRIHDLIEMVSRSDNGAFRQKLIDEVRREGAFVC